MIAIIYTLFNMKMNEVLLKTLTNGAESVFCMMAIYHYSCLVPKFNRNMVLMTMAITLGFIVRSSSIIGFIPLALFKIFSHKDYFLEILKAGVFVAIPIMMLSIGIDSFMYGRFAFPQFMFVYVNVVEDITKYFGEEVSFYFL